MKMLSPSRTLRRRSSEQVSLLLRDQLSRSPVDGKGPNSYGQAPIKRRNPNHNFTHLIFDEPTVPLIDQLPAPLG